MGMLTRALKAIGFGFVVVVFAISLTDAGIEGGSSLLKAVWGWLLGFAVIGWGVSAIARKLQNRRGEPVSADPWAKRFSDWLLEHEPLIQLGYRIAIVLLLALGIDKIDRHTWGVANEQLKRLGGIESKLSNIEDHTANIASSSSSVESNTSDIEGNTRGLRYR